jgi:hypothetical protein
MASVLAPGQRVRVRPATASRHHRTPAYVQGRPGTIVRHVGRFKDPESLAYGGDGLPERELYQVAFILRELWDAYAGPGPDSVRVNLYEHWLEHA